MIRMKDIADKVGVSRSTVSLVLNRSHLSTRISSRVRQQIEAEAEAMGYCRNELARAVVLGRTKVLGLVNYGMTYEFWGRIFDGLSFAADRRGYYIKPINIGTLSNISPSEVADIIIRKCREQQMAGLLSFSGEEPLTAAITQATGKYDIPLALVDYYGANHGFVKVVSDDAAGCRALMDYLAECGFKRAAYVAHGYPIFPFERIRTGAIISNAQRTGIEIAKRHQMITSDKASVKVESIMELMSRPQCPNLIICSTDFNAFRVLQAAQNLGVKIPGDFSVTGFGDLYYAQYSAPPLTTVRQNYESMGEAVVLKLLDLIEGKTQESICDVTIPTNLVIRDSVISQDN